MKYICMCVFQSTLSCWHEPVITLLLHYILKIERQTQIAPLVKGEETEKQQQQQ